jgi:hypothetical protein
MTDPDAPLSLQEAAQTILRGLVTASTLRAAADRGELAVERLGRRIVVTPRAISEWRELCRVAVKAQGYISNQPAETAKRHCGLSETEEDQSAQDAALAIARMLKEGSRNISAENTSPRAASVHYLKSS